MRLICPNCDAQYEVDDSVIPETGRDVQCSNCGLTWFQRPAGVPEADEEPLIIGTATAPAIKDDGDTAENLFDETADPNENVARTENAQPDGGLPGTEAPPEEEELSGIAGGLDHPAETDDSADYPPEDSDYLAADPVHAAPAGFARAAATDDVEDYMPEFEDTDDTPLPPQRRAVDESILNVLREEAERERRAREAEGSSLETQPELGLTDVPTENTLRHTQSQERMARLRGEDATAPDDLDPDDEVESDGNSRGALFPDIEEINSTLRPTSERGEDAASYDAPETVRRWRSGFRLGLVSVVAATIAMMLIYAFSPVIVARLPALGSVLIGYVETVDGWRAWVDAGLNATADALNRSVENR